MKQDIRLIGIDLDGTLLNSRKQITPRNLVAIQAALDAGIHVLPATGRQLSGVPAEFISLPGVRYAVVGNGARVLDVATGNTLHIDCFTQEAALDILNVCRTFDAVIHVCLHENIYMEALDFASLEETFPPEMIEYIRATRMPLPDILPTILASPYPVDKFVATFKDLSERERAFVHFSARPDCTATSSMPANIEINTHTANKGTGLLVLARHLGIEPSQVMAIGDGLNDVEMLTAVGYGVAMGNAAPEAVAVAAARTLSCDEDGVALAIEAIM